MAGKGFLAGLLIPFLFAHVAQGADAQGIYTEQQAAAGKALYEKNCSICHGAALMNGPRTSSHMVGNEYIEKWGAKPTAPGSKTWRGLKIGEILADNIATMPPTPQARQALTPDDQLLILTYMLQRNGFPAGTTALTATSPKLKDVSFEFTPTVGAIGKEQRLMVWVDRQGKETVVPSPPRHYYLPRISPDGKQIVVEVHIDKPDIYVVDVASGAMRQITKDGINRYPAWSPDGKRVLYSSDRTGGKPKIFWQAADGTGTAEQLTFGEHENAPQSWTPDGKQLSFAEIHPVTYRDVWMLPIDGDRKPWPLLRTPFLEGGVEYSKDGKWMVHTSNQTGKYQVMLRGFPDTAPNRQITTDGGLEAIWPRGTNEIFYRENNKRMVVEVITGATIQDAKVGTPRLMFEKDYVQSPGTRASWDSKDGQRFLMLRKAD